MPHGPVSLMRTVTERPFLGLVTVSDVPSGQVRAAAVLPLASKTSPLAVCLPEEYELANISCPAHWPDGLTYLCTRSQPAACAAASAGRQASTMNPISFTESIPALLWRSPVGRQNGAGMRRRR